MKIGIITLYPSQSQRSDHLTALELGIKQVVIIIRLVSQRIKQRRMQSPMKHDVFGLLSTLCICVIASANAQFYCAPDIAFVVEFSERSLGVVPSVGVFSWFTISYVRVTFLQFEYLFIFYNSIFILFIFAYLTGDPSREWWAVAPSWHRANSDQNGSRSLLQQWPAHWHFVQSEL